MFRVIFLVIFLSMVYANRKPKETAKSPSNRPYDAAMRHKIQMNICREKHREKMCSVQKRNREFFQCQLHVR